MRFLWPTFYAMAWADTYSLQPPMPSRGCMEQGPVYGRDLQSRPCIFPPIIYHLRHDQRKTSSMCIQASPIKAAGVLSQSPEDTEGCCKHQQPSASNHHCLKPSQWILKKALLPALWDEFLNAFIISAYFTSSKQCGERCNSMV